MRNTVTIHHQRIFSIFLPALAIAILLAGACGAATRKPRHKQPPTAPQQAQTALLEPTDAQALIQRFGALQSPAFAQWLDSALPPPMTTKSRDEAFPRAAWQSQLNLVLTQKPATAFSNKPHQLLNSLRARIPSASLSTSIVSLKYKPSPNTLPYLPASCVSSKRTPN